MSWNYLCLVLLLALLPISLANVIPLDNHQEDFSIDDDNNDTVVDDDGIRWVTKSFNGVETISTETAEDVMSDLPEKDFHVNTRGSVGRNRHNIVADDSNIFEMRIPSYLNKNVKDKYPGYAIGDLVNVSCTASLIGPFHAITSADCVYDKTNKQWKENFDLLRGYNYGTYLQHMRWKSVTIPYPFYQNGAQDFNWAYIEYQHDTDTSYSPVWLSMKYDPKLSRKFTPVTINGYIPNLFDNHMFYSYCILGNNSFNKLSVSNMMELGCSMPYAFPGGPIISDDGTKYITDILPIYAIATETRQNMLKSVLKISREMFWLIVHWMKASGHDPDCSNLINRHIIIQDYNY
jgi:hypothetical protein